MKRKYWPVWAVLFAVSALAIGCGAGGDGASAEPEEELQVFEITPEVVTFGQETYKANCAPCHGAGGKGDGPSAATLNPPPRDHTNGEYMSTLADKKLAETIKMGGIISGYPNMPSNPHLKGDQIVALIAYVRSLHGSTATEIDLTGFMLPQ